MWVKRTCSVQQTEEAGVWGVSRVSVSRLGEMVKLFTTGEEPWCMMGDMELSQLVLADLYP